MAERDDLCAHGCGDDATVQHADGRFLCYPCYLQEVGSDSEPPADCPTCSSVAERDPNTEARERWTIYVCLDCGLVWGKAPGESLCSCGPESRKRAQRVDVVRLATLEQAERALEEEREKLRGWEIRDSNGDEPCSIERGEGASLEVLASGLTQAQAEQIEDVIEALASSPGAAAETEPSMTAVWLLCERTGRPIAAYSDRDTAIKRRIELARRNPSTLDISVTEVVPVVVDPTIDELFDPAAMRKLRATEADTDATAETETSE